MDFEKQIKELQARVSELEKGSGSRKPKAEKKPREPTEFNKFVKEQLPKVKKENPDMSHKEAFAEAAKLWSKKKEST